MIVLSLLLLGGIAQAAPVYSIDGGVVIFHHGSPTNADPPFNMNFSYSDFILTPGPSRDGWVRLWMSNDGDWGTGYPYAGGSSRSSSLGPYICPSGGMQMALCYSGTFLPIRLGEPIPIEVRILVYGWAYGWVDIRAEFFEEDQGVRFPVPAIATPEPSYTPSILFAAAAFGLWRRRNNRRRFTDHGGAR